MYINIQVQRHIKGYVEVNDDVENETMKVPRRHSLHEVGMLQRSAQTVSTKSHPPEMGAPIPFLGKPVITPCFLAGSFLTKVGDVKSKSGQPHTQTNTLQPFGFVTFVTNK